MSLRKWWVVQKRLKTPLRNIKMAPRSEILKISQKSGQSVSSKKIDEISTGIKAGSKVSATTETGTTSEAFIETSLGAKFSTEVGQS